MSGKLFKNKSKGINRIQECQNTDCFSSLGNIFNWMLSSWAFYYVFIYVCMYICIYVSHKLLSIPTVLLKKKNCDFRERSTFIPL